MQIPAYSSVCTSGKAWGKRRGRTRFGVFRLRSGERRGGEEGRFWGGPDHLKKKKTISMFIQILIDKLRGLIRLCQLTQSLLAPMYHLVLVISDAPAHDESETLQISYLHRRC